MIMTAEELTQRNVGENLDQLMNLDPRGYGVCRILYDGARKFMKGPLTMTCAKGLHQILTTDDIVYIITGFVLLPNKHAEMDGIVSSMLLARALVKAYGVKPLIICPKECMEAVKSLSTIIGLHLYLEMEEFISYPISIGAYPFTKEKAEASAQADWLLEKVCPKAVIAIEAPGANICGVYHNSAGKDLTELEAKTDILFTKCKERGIWNMAIGDLGNELGMGAIKSHLQKYIPYMAKDGCTCACHGGSMAMVAADHIITATISDWGCYGLIAALAYLNHDIELLQDGELEEEAIKTASNSGMVDMYGWLEYAIDGVGMQMHCQLVELMRSCIQNTFRNEKRCTVWFDKVLEKQYFNIERVQ